MKTKTRSLRHIKSAIIGHGYEVDYYNEFNDGSVEFVKTGFISIVETNVRLRQSGPAWEERVSSCPGWFRCDALKIA